MPKKKTKSLAQLLEENPELAEAYKSAMSEIGRKGGSSRSTAKQKASRTNARKYRTEAERKKARARANARYYEKRMSAKETE